MMSSSLQIERRIVPRWRSLATTLRLNELGPSTSPKLIAPSSNEAILEKRLTAWNGTRDLVTASELLEAEITSGGEEGAATSAAQYILGRDDATPMLRRLAELGLAHFNSASQVASNWLPHSKKASLRAQLIAYPRNPLVWAELSLLDLLSTRRRFAVRDMLVALQLAPNNRHVLRSAARLFLNLGQPDRALATLRGTDRTLEDPWLMAAEIAVASVNGMSSVALGRGRKLLSSSDFSDWDLSELSGAIATEEMLAGRNKRARDLFRRSAIEPTGNALAQVAWASPKFGGELVTSPTYTEEGDEAQAITSSQVGDVASVLDSCQKWATSEPYSIRPFEMASAAAAEREMYDETLDLANRGLRIRPLAPWLLNNKAFALINKGRLVEAEAVLSKVPASEEFASLARIANEGLIQIKLGNIERGEAKYVEAVLGFRKTGNSRLAAVAGCYLAKALADAQVGYAAEVLRAATRTIERYKIPGLTAMMRMVEDRFELGRRARSMEPMPMERLQLATLLEIDGETT